LSAYMLMLSRVSILWSSLSGPPESSPFTFTAQIYQAEASTGYRYFISIAISSGYQEAKRFAVIFLLSTPYGNALWPLLGGGTPTVPGYMPPATATAYITPSWRYDFPAEVCSSPYGVEQLYRVSEISGIINSWISCWISIPPGEGVSIGVYMVDSNDYVNQPIGVFVCTEERCKYQELESNTISPPARTPAIPPWTKDQGSCSVVASWYGSHGPDFSTSHSGFARLVTTRGNDRVYYTVILRQQETSGWEAAALAIKPPNADWIWLTPEGVQRLSAYARLIGSITMRVYSWPGGYAYSSQDFDRFFSSSPTLIWSGQVDRVFFYEFDGCWWCQIWYSFYAQYPFPQQQKDYFASWIALSFEIQPGNEGIWGFAVDSDDAADILLCENTGPPGGQQTTTTPIQFTESMRGTSFEHGPVVARINMIPIDPSIIKSILCIDIPWLLMSPPCGTVFIYPGYPILTTIVRNLQLLNKLGDRVYAPGSLVTATGHYAFMVPSLAPQVRGGDVDPFNNQLSAPAMKLLEPAGYFAKDSSGSFGILNLTSGTFQKVTEIESGGIYYFYGGSSGINALWGYRSNIWSGHITLPTPDIVLIKGIYWVPQHAGIPDAEKYEGRPLQITYSGSLAQQIARFPGINPSVPVFMSYVDPGGGMLICYPYPGSQNYLPVPRCQVFQNSFIIPDYTKQPVIQGKSLDPLITISRNNYLLSGLDTKGEFEWFLSHPRWASIGYMIKGDHDFGVTPVRGPIKFFVAATIPVMLLNIPGKGLKAIYGATSILIAADAIPKMGEYHIVLPTGFGDAKMIPWYTDPRLFYLVDLNDLTQRNDPPINAPQSGSFLLYWDSYSFNPSSPLLFRIGAGENNILGRIHYRVIYAVPPVGIYGYYCRLDKTTWLHLFNPSAPLPAINPDKSSCYNWFDQVIYDWRQVMYSLPNVPQPWPKEFEDYLSMGGSDPFTGLNIVTYPSPGFAVAIIPVK
ncbi:MAG: hypothetical protein QXE01_11755, partial [Sulfolobales archaeon]